MKTYVLGFALSIALTLTAFWVAPQLGVFTIPVIIAAAFFQLIVQLVFFLHLGHDRKKKSDVVVFFMTLAIVGIVVGGTLWIMSNLAHLHVHSPSASDIYQGGVVAPQNELH